MRMKNKEQLLYFFLQGKISLSQYDYKFMANLQTMIQNNTRVTSNQATLFDKLISKYKKQLTKNGLVKEELKELSWKTIIVESTAEFTGAVVSLIADTITIRVPFNKSFIHDFRNIKNNAFEWDKETKLYTAPFSTTNLKIAVNTLPNFFSTVRYDDELQNILDQLTPYEGLIWNPTLKYVNGKPMIAAINSVLGNLVNDIDLVVDPKVIFTLSRMGINIDPEIYASSTQLEFAAKWVYYTEFSEMETVISWMKDIGCQIVMIGRALRTLYKREEIEQLVQKYGMAPVISYGLPGSKLFNKNVTMLLQHTTVVDHRINSYLGYVSKTVVLRDSRPIEVL